MQQSVNTSTRTLAHVEQWMDSHTGHLFNLARRFCLDYEDVYQEAYVLALEYLQCDATNWSAYLFAKVKYHFLHKQEHELRTVSLDRPFHDTDLTLGDCLAAMPAQPQEAENAKEDMLYNALHALPLDEQMFFRSRFNLHYELRPDARIDLPGRAHDAIRKTAYVRLRKLLNA